MHRRDLLTTASSISAALAAPSIARAQDTRTLRFVPQADPGILDPIITTGLVNRNHGFLVFDTLYGVNEALRVQPQMVDGHTLEDGGKTWAMTLRSGLRFHDGAPVLARDVVASLRRWGLRDTFGSSVFEVVDELAAPDDRTVRWRLNRPFPLLPEALGKVGSIVAFIMPERLAATSSTVPVNELIGSGPFRFLADEYVPGARLAYRRFADYVPRPQGTPSLLAGPKRVHVDRIEWQIIPDPATAAEALLEGEIDWWDQPTFDLVPLLRRNRTLAVGVLDTFGNVGVLRFNHTLPPFNNPAVRRAVLGAVNQSDAMAAVAGKDRSLWRDGVGFFAPGSALATTAGMEALNGPRDLIASRRMLQQAGYKGEAVLLLAPTDFPSISALSEVIADLFRKLGITLEYVTMDWGSMLRRVGNREVPERGGYNAFCTYATGVSQLDPAAHNFLRGNGDKATFGWPVSPRLEELRESWLAASDDAARKHIAEEMQVQAFLDVPYVPLGVFYQPTAHQRDLAGVLKGPPLFWNVRRT